MFLKIIPCHNAAVLKSDKKSPTNYPLKEEYSKGKFWGKLEIRGVIDK